MHSPSHSMRPDGKDVRMGRPDRLMEDPMDHFVKLDHFPEDLMLPPQFQNRLEFDAEAHKLVFHGYMSKSEFDQLSSLTPRLAVPANPRRPLPRSARPDSKPAPVALAASWPLSANCSRRNERPRRRTAADLIELTPTRRVSEVG